MCVASNGSKYSWFSTLKFSEVIISHGLARLILLYKILSLGTASGIMVTSAQILIAIRHIIRYWKRN